MIAIARPNPAMYIFFLATMSDSVSEGFHPCFWILDLSARYDGYL